MTLILVITSLCTQIAAFILALRLIRTTGGSLVWVFLAGAVAAQTLRRFLTLGDMALSGAYLTAFHTVQEAVGLAVSILMLAGMAWAAKQAGRDVARGKRPEGTMLKNQASLIEPLSPLDPKKRPIIAAAQTNDDKCIPPSLGRMEAICRETRGVAHDFKNLLTVISEQSELVINSLDNDHPMYKKILAIREAGRKAFSLTDLLLALDQGQNVERQSLNLSKIVGGMDVLLSRVIGEDIKIVFELQEDAWPIRGNTVQLEQVLLNLALNAREAMPLGGTLTIETSNILIHAEQRLNLVPGPYVMLAVSDDGCGMNPKTVSRIFEPSFTTKNPRNGNGLGLSTVYDIVKQMHGEILVYSEPNQGTAFKIYLPIIQGNLDLHEDLPEETSRPLKNFDTLMVVEDDAEVRALVTESLELDGYQVLAATDSEEALEIIKNHTGPIALLISDVAMPKMNGPQLIKKVKSLRPETNFILMSGYTEAALYHENLIEDKTMFLQKPFTLDNLIKKVRESLANANEKFTFYQ